jgi:hypothetical protein
MSITARHRIAATLGLWISRKAAVRPLAVTGPLGGLYAFTGIREDVHKP